MNTNVETTSERHFLAYFLLCVNYFCDIVVLLTSRLFVLIENRNHTAILVFSRTEKEEAVSKQFLPVINKRFNQKIAGILIKNTLELAKKSNLPYFFIDSSRQHGNSFGEKFSQAIEDVFAQDYQQVIAIGNDCPNLTTNDILIASQNLTQGNLTIGPANDGGAYLLAIDNKSFCYETFKNLNWQSEKLFLELGDYLSNQSRRIIFLNEKEDIDTYLDLVEHLQYNPKNQFSIEVLEIIKNLLVQFSEIIGSISNIYFCKSSFGLRAPPLVSA